MDYSSTFTDSYHSGDQEQYGSAALSLAERTALKQMYHEVVAALGNDTPRDIIREAIQFRILQSGWVIPEHITAESLAEEATYHGCVVAAGFNS
jgi:hypothetical protein